MSTFPTVTVTTKRGPLTVICEPVSDQIVITPTTAVDDEGRDRLGAGFVLTHAPTGYRFPPNQACIGCCRESGRQLVALDIDWSRVKTKEDVLGLGDEMRQAVGRALRPVAYCDAEVCVHSAEGQPVT